MAVLEALKNFSRYRDEHRRSISTWNPKGRSSYELIASLAAHLFDLHPTPLLLSKAWFEEEGEDADRRRRWHIAHGRGTPFRKLCGRDRMTRRMEHFFLKSPPHLTLDAAIRRAEILALGGSTGFASRLLESRLGTLTGNSLFWRSVIEFLVRHEDKIEPQWICPTVAYLDELRHGDTSILTAAGEPAARPLHPDYSIHGRSLGTLLRPVRLWHGQLNRRGLDSVSWGPSGLRGLVHDEPTHCSSEGRDFTRWCVIELLGSRQLFHEGLSMRNCVAGYTYRCRSRRTSIWSVRRLTSAETWQSVLTVEVDPNRRRVVEALARCNRPARGRAYGILERWARLEKLEVAIE